MYIYYRDEGRIKTGAQGPICRPPAKCKLQAELNYVIASVYFVILSIRQSANVHFEICDISVGLLSGGSHFPLPLFRGQGDRSTDAAIYSESVLCRQPGEHNTGKSHAHS